MTRYVLAGRLGPGDTGLPGAGEKEVLASFDLVARQRNLGRGIGSALQYLRDLGVRPSEIGVDLIVVAAHVHAADTRLNRVIVSQDAWTRDIGLIVPVSAPDVWTAASPVLERMLRFLTGDHWTVAFRPRAAGFETLSPAALPDVEPCAHDGVALFSGGLDSLVGAIDTVASGGRPLFVSHAGEGAVSRPQSELFEAFAEAASRGNGRNEILSRLRFAMNFRRNLVPDAGSEDSTRSRSFLFLSIGALAGSGLPGVFDLRIPENGLIALNVPLDPTRLGSNSTRTTHPFYLHRWNELLARIGIRGRVVNRYWARTKGEMLAECRDQKLLRDLAARSVSCAHPSLGRYYGDPHRHCGTCVPCVIRRAALEEAWGRGNDPTGYRCSDLSARPLDATKAEGQQIRGFQYAVNKVAEQPHLARVLVHKPGPLDEDRARLNDIAGVYARGMKEVGRLLRNVRTYSSAMPERP